MLLLSGLAVVATKVIATETLPVHFSCFICTPAALPHLGPVQPLPQTCQGVGQEEAKPILPCVPGTALSPARGRHSGWDGVGKALGMGWGQGWEQERGQGWEWGQSCPLAAHAAAPSSSVEVRVPVTGLIEQNTGNEGLLGGNNYPTAHPAQPWSLPLAGTAQALAAGSDRPRRLLRHLQAPASGEPVQAVPQGFGGLSFLFSFVN